MASERDGVIRLDTYAAEAKQLVAGAQQLADERGHAEVTPLHLMARATERSAGFAAVLKSAGAPPHEVAELCEAALKKLPKTGGGVAYVSPRLLDLLDRAEREQKRDKVSEVGVAQLLHALAQEMRSPVGEILSHYRIGPGGFRDHLAALDRPGAATPLAVVASANAEFIRDLVADARADRFDPVIGRDAEIRRLLQILERRFKNHPLVIGEPGVGKTTLIRGLARRLAAGDVPSNLAGARLLELDTGALVAGAKLRGEIELRLKTVMDRLQSTADVESIVVVEELHALFGQGVTGSGVGELLKPLLARSDVRFLATTTVDGVQKIDERDQAILRRFSAFTIDPPSVELAQEILRGIGSRYEQHHRVRISEGAIRTAVVLAKRYVADRALPDSAVDLLDETASGKRVAVDGVPAETDAAMRRLESLAAQRATLEGDDDKLGKQTLERIDAELKELEPKVAELRKELESRRGAAPEIAVLAEEDVARTVNEWTGIPVAKMLEGEAEKLLKMEERLAKRVIGQSEAVQAVARAVRRGRVGLRNPGKPIGSFLFLGPSGVGKTHLAKALAEFLFDDEQALTRLDMSEFMEKHMAQRLIGAPPGYADSEQGGHLTEAVRRRPYSVLLFDEVEKAHQDVFNLMLQVLDDGRLTDGRGRTADFSNTVVIMTSNIGSARILETDAKLFESPDGREAIRDVLMLELHKFFRPEFLNRIDEVVVFKGLSKQDLLGIVDIELHKLGRMLADREMKLDVSAAAKQHFVDVSYEPAFGARPLNRTIVRELQNPLAESILQGGALAGTLKVDLSGDKVTFTR